MRVLRGVRITERPKEKRAKRETGLVEAAAQNVVKPVVQMGESLFGAKPSGGSGSSSFSMAGAANPFSTPSSSSSSSNNPFSKSSAPPHPSMLAAKPPQSPTSDLPQTFAAALSLNNTTPRAPEPAPEPWPSDDALPAAYPRFYLVDADYEQLDAPSSLPLPAQAMEIDNSEPSASAKEEKDVYESTIDTTFQKFADRLAQNPEQVIRYEWKGMPLLCSKVDAVGRSLGVSGHEKIRAGKGMPRCGRCGANRVFEVQVMPHAITELEAEEMSLEGMEWGTIVMGVCEMDCVVQEDLGAVSYTEEWAGVQWEEEAGKGR